MIAYLITSPYGSLNFDDDWRQKDQQCVDYTQKFIADDTVKIQYAVSKGNDQSWSSLDIRLYNLDTNESTPIVPSPIEQTDAYTFYNATIVASAGCFRVAFELTDKDGNVSVIKESTFQVLADLPTEDEDQLIRFRYNNAENKDNTIFDSDFYFRCEAAFFPQSETYNVEDNNFRDQEFDLSMMSAEASTIHGLTVGGKLGIPSWVAKKLSYIFSCTEVYIGEVDDDVEYVFSDGSSIERTPMGDMYPLYVFTINLEKTVTAANAVKIGVVTPVGDSDFEIDPIWLELEYNDAGVANPHFVSVVSPDENWTVSAQDPSWLTAARSIIGGVQRATIIVTENVTGATRSQTVTFTWTDLDTGAVLTRTMIVNQLKAGEDINYINVFGHVYDSETYLPLAGALVSLWIDNNWPNILNTDDAGKFNYRWPVSKSQYEEVTKLTIRIGKNGYENSPDAIMWPLPSFESAIQNGIGYSDKFLDKTQ